MKKIQGDKMLRKFLEDNFLCPESIDFDAEAENFINEMKKGLISDSSLAMIPSYIKESGSILENKRVIAVDAGGTNLRIAALRFNENSEMITDYYQSVQMPGFNDPIDAEVFFDRLANAIKPISDYSESIGFCFSYTMQILPNLDGLILGLSKELKITGLEGKKLGKELNESFIRNGICSAKKITVTNDACACLLGGKALTYGKAYGSYIALILGTGLNACYYENCKAIKKSQSISGLTGKMIVNTEAGGYDPLFRGGVDIVMDAATNDPLVHKLEKMTSGAYIGRLLRAAVEEGAKTGVISAKTDVSCLFNVTSSDVSDYLLDRHSENLISSVVTDTADADAIYETCLHIILRAAKICAEILRAIIKKNALEPPSEICLSADGSMFNKSVVFRKAFERYVGEYASINQAGIHAETSGIKITIVTSDNLTLFGSAIAAAQNMNIK